MLAGRCSVGGVESQVRSQITVALTPTVCVIISVLTVCPGPVSVYVTIPVTEPSVAPAVSVTGAVTDPNLPAGATLVLGVLLARLNRVDGRVIVLAGDAGTCPLRPGPVRP